MADGSKIEDFKPDRQIEMTEAMVEAGVERLTDLLMAGVGSAYVVSEVFQAMMADSPYRKTLEPLQSKICGR